MTKIHLLITLILFLVTSSQASIIVTDSETGKQSHVTRILSQENTALEDISNYSYIAYTLDLQTPSGNTSLILTDASGNTWKQSPPLHITSTHNVIQIPLAQVSPTFNLGAISKIQAISNNNIELPISFIRVFDFPITQKTEGETLYTTETIKTETLAPELTIKVDDKTILDGDYIKNTPQVTVKTTTSPVSSSIKLVNTQTHQTVAESQTATLTVTTPLPDGTYQAFATLNFGTSIATTNTKTAIIQTSFDLKNCINVPNPFNPNIESTEITYTLTKDADVTLYIYTLNGELQEKISISAGHPGATSGYNSLTWNGKNQFHETLANGIYIAYIIAKTEGKIKKGKVKLWVRK